MLTEDQVVNAVSASLERNGWTIRSRALAHQRGDDIVATCRDKTLVVEAKGGGSSKPGTKRYGLEFTRGQCHINVGMAVLRALRVTAAGRAAAGVAFPDTPHYRRELDAVRSALERLQIQVWLVAPNLDVRTF